MPSSSLKAKPLLLFVRVLADAKSRAGGNQFLKPTRKNTQGPQQTQSKSGRYSAGQFVVSAKRVCRLHLSRSAMLFSQTDPLALLRSSALISESSNTSWSTATIISSFDRIFYICHGFSDSLPSVFIVQQKLRVNWRFRHARQNTVVLREQRSLSKAHATLAERSESIVRRYMRLPVNRNPAPSASWGSNLSNRTKAAVASSRLPNRSNARPYPFRQRR